MCFFVFLWSESATTLRQDWTNTCVLEPCKNDASEREERKSPNPGKRSAKRSVRVYAANCDGVTCLSKLAKFVSKSSLFWGWPGSPGNVSCSSVTADLHQYNLPGHPPKRLLAPSQTPIDLGALREFGGCTTQRALRSKKFNPDFQSYPKGPARHLDASRQKLTPHCLAAILTLNYPRPNCLLKCLPNCLSPTIENIFSCFKIAPVVRVIAGQLSGKNCLAAIFASRHQDASPGPLGSLKFSISIEIFSLNRKFQSIENFYLRGPPGVAEKGSIEKLQSTMDRSKFSIPKPAN